MRELTCQEFVELITKYLDGTLDEELENRFVRHLSTCRGCESYLDQFQQTIGALGDMGSDALSPAVRDSLIAAFREPAVKSRRETDGTD
jgi:anti-sigma factor RsiW